MATTIFLGLCAAVWLPYGIYCFVAPEFLVEAAGVADRLGRRAERQRDDPRLLPLLVERQVAAARRDERRAVDVEPCCRRLAALRAPPALRGGPAERRRAAEARHDDAAQGLVEACWGQHCLLFLLFCQRLVLMQLS